MLVWAFALDATAEQNTPSPPAALREIDQVADFAELQRKLPAGMSVARHGHIVIAASGSEQNAVRWAQRIAAYDAQMRLRFFAGLEKQRLIVILADSASELRRIAELLYPDASDSTSPRSGFYHPRDRLILATTVDGYGGVLHGLMHALIQDDNPSSPGWFQEAMATLYESGDWSTTRLVPALDERMALIRRDEDLSYDVFAGICDCSDVTAGQLALIRLLLIFLDERNRLAALYGVIKVRGQYTTLLEALEAADLDGEAWKQFAEQSVRNYWKSIDQSS